MKFLRQGIALTILGAGLAATPGLTAQAAPSAPSVDDRSLVQPDRNNFAPRLGFAWDVMSDQKLKVYGSWGYYYDISKLNIRGSFGGDKWIEYMYPLNTLDWETIPAQGNCTNSTNNASINPCPGFGTPVTSDLRYPADPSDPLFGVDPDIKPFQQE